jgi:hypothetical protein
VLEITYLKPHCDHKPSKPSFLYFLIAIMQSSSSEQLSNIDIIKTAPLSPVEQHCISLITANRSLKFSIVPPTDRKSDQTNHPLNPQPQNLISFLQTIHDALTTFGQPAIALSIQEALQQATSSPDFGGYGLSASQSLSAEEEAQIKFLLGAYIEALNCADRAQHAPIPLTERPAGRRGMTLTEKILAMHDVSRKGWVAPGEVVQVDIDWVLASELSWGVRTLSLFALFSGLMRS